MNNKIVEFKKNDFDLMILQDKSKIIELIKSEQYIRIFYSTQRYFDYKVFTVFTPDLFIKKTDNDILADDQKAIILFDFDFSNADIFRENFRFWYFLGNEASFYKTKFYGNQTNFSGSEFFCENVDFFSCEFRAERSDFSACNFKTVKTVFSESRFYGRQSYFLGSKFYGKITDFSKCEFHSKQTDFSKAEFITDKLTFFNADFLEYVNLDVNYFSVKNVFTGSTFRMGADFDVGKLCEKENKLAKPVKLKLSANFKTKENFHAVKRLLNKNEKYEEEDHMLYWYKVYERKSNKKILRKIFFPFEWLILDKMTGYFTKSSKVLLSILLILLLFFMIFSVAIIIDNDAFGDLTHNEITLSEELYDENITFSVRIRKVFGNILYFNLVTYSTLGYGDILPTGLLKIISGIEGVIGVLLNSIFLIVLTRKILR